MAVGTQRFFLGGGRGQAFVFITPDGFFLVFSEGLFNTIEKISEAYPDATTLQISKDVHEVLRQQLHKRQGTLVHFVHRIHDLWIEVVDGERTIRIR